MRETMSSSLSKLQIEAFAAELIEQDAEEHVDNFGQELRETYHQADVFVDGMNLQRAKAGIERFVKALFGDVGSAPSKSEYGMYAAKSASLRSNDLSRQVGAAIVSDDGQIVSQGCNEVPKALGGTYWDLEEPDNRDVRLGRDPNEGVKRYILKEIFERLYRCNLLMPELTSLGSVDNIVDHLTKGPAIEDKDSSGLLRRASVLDLTEYGRVVHAEMCAICDAARVGRPIKGTTLYCTTFPCHNCAKHILACGIVKVVYIEPYAKSKAYELHANEISLEDGVLNKVSFIPFLGISPFRYRDIFQKGRRKSIDGSAKQWYYDVPRPMVDIVSAAYVETEGLVLAEALLGSVARPE